MDTYSPQRLIVILNLVFLFSIYLSSFNSSPQPHQSSQAIFNKYISFEETAQPISHNQAQNSSLSFHLSPFLLLILSTNPLLNESSSPSTFPAQFPLSESSRPSHHLPLQQRRYPRRVQDWYYRKVRPDEIIRRCAT